MVIPSEWYETFCLVVLEAYAAGKAVLASRLGSLPYVVQEGETGLLFFEAGSPDDLAAKATELLQRDDDTLRLMGRSGRRLAETRYSAKENYLRLMEIFSSVSPARSAEALPLTLT